MTPHTQGSVSNTFGILFRLVFGVLSGIRGLYFQETLEHEKKKQTWEGPCRPEGRSFWGRSSGMPGKGTQGQLSRHGEEMTQTKLQKLPEHETSAFQMERKGRSKWVQHSLQAQTTNGRSSCRRKRQRTSKPFGVMSLNALPLWPTSFKMYFIWFYRCFTTCVPAVQKRPKEGIWSTGTGVTDGSVPPYECWESNLGSLEEQTGCFTSELSPQPWLTGF